ncbi:GtrA family protein [Clostridiaceae bacterium Marseille-Q4143]|nr:GtrA family protein [Clostridiaceae bacterium Marseille-Q4143]
MNGIWKLLEKIIRFILEKTIHINISADQWNGLVQFIKFGIVGLSNTVISYLLYVGALLIFQKKQWIPSIDYLVAQVIAFVLSVLWSFYWNNKYVFKQNEGQERNIFAALLKTYVSYAFTGLFLNSVLSFIWVEIIGVSKLIAPIINLLVSVPINFLMNKFWAFKTESK